MASLQGLVSNDGQLYAMWKGIPGDERIFYSRWNGTGPWSPKAPMQGLTSMGPSVTVYDGAVYAAWKGQFGDPRLFYAIIGTNGIWSPQATIPWAYSDVGPALGAIGNKLVAVWKNAWDQTLWYSLFDGRAWSAGKLIPGPESNVGPSLALYNGRLYVAFRGVYGNEHLFYMSFDGTNWSAAEPIPSASSSVGPSLAGVGTKLYAMWKGLDADQGLYWSSFDGKSWAPQAQVPGVGSSVGPAISAYNGVLYAMWKGAGADNTLWMSHLNGTTWAPHTQPLVGSTGQDPVPGGTPVAQPGAGLRSGSNYFLASNCAHLAGVQVLIGITEDLVTAAPTGTPQNKQQGFAFQFNCSSSVPANPQNAEWTVWQQYIIGIGGNSMLCAANNFTAASLSGNQSIDFPAQQVATLARANTIPAGSTISIQLTFDSAGNVTGGTFNLTPGGTPKPIVLTSGKLSSGEQITTADLAPITAFELNLVGPGDYQHAHFVSGAGKIVYLASLPLTALSSLPTCVANNATTGESSNSAYGLLPSGSSFVVSQTFSVDTTIQ